MTTRQQEDLLHVLTRLDHLSAHLADISTDVSNNEPYNRDNDIAAQEIYINACALIRQGQEFLQRFNPDVIVPEGSGYTPAAKWMPDMPLRCCLGCAPHGNTHGMSEEDVRAGQTREPEAVLEYNEEEDEDEVYCPVCGGFGGESYGSDSGTCDECGGSGYVSANYENDEEE